jgi:hypothetical protein
MSTNLMIEVSDATFQALVSDAVNGGKTPSEVAAAVVERYVTQPTKRSRAKRPIGEVLADMSQEQIKELLDF